LSQQRAVVDLDAIRRGLHDWSESRWVPRGDRGGFRRTADGDAHLMSTFDMAWLRYALDDLDTIGEDMRGAWIRWIRQNQCREDGSYRYPPGESHCDGHAFWMAVRALNILGGQLALFPKHIGPAMRGPEGLRQWFRTWERDSFNHHDVLGIAPILAGTDDPEWIETFYDELRAQQDDATGTWPKGSTTNISRTYAYTVVFRATDRVPPQPDKIVDAMIALQHEDGSWGKGYRSMDAVYVLVRLAPLIGHRQDDALEALRRNADWLPAMYARRKPELMNDPHEMVAVVHNFGLLAEVFPDAFHAETPWRFNWEDPALYRCDVIQDHLRQVAGPKTGPL